MKMPLGGDLISTHRKLTPRRPPRFELCGGALCLDFINTLDDRYSSEPKELLETYLDLVRFAEDAGIVTGSQLDRLYARGVESSAVAQHVLERAIRMREAMHEVFWALLHKKPAPRSALMVLNGYVQEAMQHVSLVPANGHFKWEFDPSPDNLDAPLWQVARSAAELLASDQVGYVRACASKTCEWLFLDESKNHRRRWCDMTKCGNRAKVKRFYKRQKKQV